VYHSITIGEKNTWDNWHLIPTSRPFVALPTVNEKIVEIPGRNGVIDLTSFLTGSPTYGNRKGSWEFYIVNPYFLYADKRFITNASNWRSSEAAYHSIASYCHGKVRSIVLEDDPDHSYSGRLKVSLTPDAKYSKITISYDLDPYRTKTSDNSHSFD
jgi:hypothetical protein